MGMRHWMGLNHSVWCLVLAVPRHTLAAEVSIHCLWFMRCGSCIDGVSVLCSKVSPCFWPWIYCGEHSCCSLVK